MTPAKKQFLPFKAAAATAVAMGAFAQANGAELNAAPAAVAATAPVKVSTPEASTTIRFKITSPYGERQDPRNRDSIEDHKGIDFAPLSAARDIPVFLPLGHGRVTRASYNLLSGRYVDVSYGTDNKGNEIELRFLHLRKTFVRKGQEIGRGTKIGLVGDTGLSTGEHLHVGLYINGKPADPALFDSSTVKNMDAQPSAEMFDVVKTGRGRHATYTRAPDAGTPILVALDPAMPAVISKVRELEKPQKLGDPICIPHDGDKELTCGGINALSQNIPAATLLGYTDKEIQRKFEGLYVTCGARHAPSSEKLIYFNDCVNFGPEPAKRMLAKAGGDAFLLLKLGSLRYDLIMEKNPGLRAQYRDGWNGRQLTLFTDSGFEARHKFREIELIPRYSSRERSPITEVAVRAKKIPEKKQPILAVESPRWVLAQTAPNSSHWTFNSQSVDFSRGNFAVKNAAPFAIMVAASVPTAVMKASNNAAFVSNKTTAEIVGGALTLVGLMTAALAWGDELLSKLKAIPAALQTRRRKAKLAAAIRRAPETVVPLKKRETPPPLPVIPVRATSAPEVIKPALVEAAQAAPHREATVAHIEPRMTVPADIPAARQEPKVTTLPDVEMSGPTLGRTTFVMTPREATESQSSGAAPVLENKPQATVATGSRAPIAAITLREGGKHSVLPDGKGWRVDYPDKSFSTVEKGLITAHNVRADSDKAVNRALQLAEKIQGDNINAKINYTSGASMTVEKDRIAVNNAQSAEDIVVERALRQAAERFKGNFKIKVRGDTAAERYAMASRVKSTALRLGLANRVVLMDNDDAARVMTMRAHRTDIELTANRPAAKRADLDVPELKRA